MLLEDGCLFADGAEPCAARRRLVAVLPVWAADLALDPSSWAGQGRPFGGLRPRPQVR